MPEQTIDAERMERDSNFPPQQMRRLEDDSTVSVLDLLLVAARAKWKIFGAALIAGVLAVGISFLMPNIYTGTAKILPPQQNQSLTSMVLSQLGPLAGMVNGGGGDFLRDPNDMYVSMIQSRTVADALIKRFNLQEHYRKKTLDDTRLDLDAVTDVHSGKDGVIEIDFQDKDPVFASTVANAYVQELMNLASRIASEDAVNRRSFFARELEEAKNNLSDAEVALLKMQEKTGLIALDDQARAIIEATATLRGQITAKEVQIQAMGTFATNNNPDYIRQKEELAGLYAQLRKLEQEPNKGSGDIMVPTGSVPSVGLEYTRRLRDVKYYETIFEILSKQFEAAKFDQGNTIATIEVMDWAVTPEKRTSPKRGLMGIIGFACGLFAAMLWLFAKTAHERAMTDTAYRGKCKQLRKALVGDRRLPMFWRRVGPDELADLRGGSRDLEK